MKHNIIIWFAALILIISIPAFASNDTTITGFYQDELNYFSSITAPTLTNKPQTSPKGMPYIIDVDNDGIKEIMIIANNNLIVYHHKNLTFVDSIKLNATSGAPYFFDIDQDIDGTTEIIIPSPKHIQIINYSNDNLVMDKSLSITNGGNRYSQSACRLNGTSVSCVHTSADASNKVRAIPYNFSSVSASTYLLYNNLAPASIDVFPPLTPLIVAADVDDNNIDEFVLSYMIRQTGGGDEEAYVWIIDVPDSSLSLTFKEFRSTAPSHITDGDAFKYITSPIVYDFMPANEGLEIIVGFNLDSDNYRMYMIDKDGGKIDEFPEILQGDGTILSNSFRANIYENSGVVEYCIMGLVEDEEKMELTCASKQDSPFTPETEEFTLFNAGNTSIVNGNPDSTVWTTLTHGINSFYDNGEFNAQSEIITSLGIYSLEYGYLGIVNHLNEEFTMPKASMAITPSDIDMDGRTELIGLSPSNLWVISDSFTNSQAEIIEYTINPCIESVWKINTTAEITITVDDIDNDNVAARTELYSGHATYLQNRSWAGNYSSGANIMFSGFVANQTIGSGVIKLFAKDVENYESTPQTKTLSFGVAENGVEYGDCITTGTFELEGETPTVTTLSESEANTESNAIKTAFDNEIFSNLGFGYTLIWLIIMVVIAYAVWVGGSHLNPLMSFGVIAIMEVLLFIIGVYLDFLSTTLLITIIIICLIGIGIWISRSLTGTHSSS